MEGNQTPPGKTFMEIAKEAEQATIELCKARRMKRASEREAALRTSLQDGTDTVTTSATEKPLDL